MKKIKLILALLFMALAVNAQTGSTNNIVRDLKNFAKNGNNVLTLPMLQKADNISINWDPGTVAPDAYYSITVDISHTCISVTVSFGYDASSPYSSTNSITATQYKSLLNRLAKMRFRKITDDNYVSPDGGPGYGILVKSGKRTIFNGRDSMLLEFDGSIEDAIAPYLSTEQRNIIKDPDSYRSK